jgi:DNA-binding transcriptional ArsR family regulator
MTEGSQATLRFLQKHSNKEYTKREIVEQIDYTMSIVSSSINNFLKKGLVEERVEKGKVVYRNEDEGKTKYYKISELGLKFDPDEEERKKAELHLQELALNRERRRRQREELAKLNSVK